MRTPTPAQLRSRSTPPAALLLALAFAACGGLAGPAGAPGAAGSGFAAVVTNKNFYDVVVRASIRGTEVRLGTVATGETRVLRLPAHLQPNTRYLLVAEPIGPGTRILSREIEAAADVIPVFTVNQTSTTSVVSLRRRDAALASR